jgi:glycosyltransferase involved in cell wall biosynthesis
MPVWNGERYLREAVDSILGQTFRRFEFIVLDDGSTDGTAEILGQYAGDPRLRVVPLNHGGIVHALNRGIAESRSSWIARMDCDDVAHPERLEKQWHAVSTAPDVVLCYTRVKLVGDPIYIPGKLPRFPRSEVMLRLLLCFQCPIAHPSTLLRKEAVLAAGGYKPEERHAEDYALWARMMARGRFVGIPEFLLNLRVHGGSISKRAAETQLQLADRIRAEIISNLFQNDAARAEILIKGLIGEVGGFRAGDSVKLAHLLARYHLLNFETALWLGVQSHRRIFKPVRG